MQLKFHFPERHALSPLKGRKLVNMLVGRMMTQWPHLGHSADRKLRISQTGPRAAPSNRAGRIWPPAAICPSTLCDVRRIRTLHLGCSLIIENCLCSGLLSAHGLLAFGFLLVFCICTPPSFTPLARFLEDGIGRVIIGGDAKSWEKSCDRFSPVLLPLYFHLFYSIQYVREMCRHFLQWVK